MKYYLKIYRQILSINLSNLLIHRANFINNIVSSMAWGIFSIISMLLLTSKTTVLYGWSRPEILLLTGAQSVLVGIFHTFFSRNFEKLSEIINRGQLDVVLTKPVDSQFLITTRYINYTSIFRIFVGIFVIYYLLINYSIPITFFSLIGFLFFLIIGLLILYNIWMLVLTITIWLTKLSNLPDFMYSFTSITRYPSEVFREVTGYVFIFLLPITIIITAPVKLLILHPNIVELITMLIIVAVFTFLSRRFWLFALKFYTSAGG